MLISLGFTGTRRGMTQAQRAQVIKFLRDEMPEEAHHGDCVGADAEFAKLLWWQFRGITVIAHPPIDPTFRAYSSNNVLMPKLPYLERNANIVQSSEHVIATPWQMERPATTRGSGTWWTINYAIRKAIPVTVFMPDGSILPMEAY